MLVVVSAFKKNKRQLTGTDQKCLEMRGSNRSLCDFSVGITVFLNTVTQKLYLGPRWGGEYLRARSSPGARIKLIRYISLSRNPNPFCMAADRRLFPR